MRSTFPLPIPSDTGAGALTATPSAAGRGDAALDPALAAHGRDVVHAAVEETRPFERPRTEGDGAGGRTADWVSAGLDSRAAALGSSTEPGVGGDRERPGGQGAGRGDEGLASVNPSAVRPEATPAEAGSRTEAASGSRTPIEQVVERIGLLRREGRQEISLRLDPPELGTVRIEAVLQRGHLTLDIRTELGRGRELLEQGMPQLRQALADLGMSSAQVTVNLGLDSSGREAPWRQFAPFGEPALAGTPPSAPRAAAPSAPRAPSARGFDRWV
jgi:hypothetical protein